METDLNRNPESAADSTEPRSTLGKRGLITIPLEIRNRFELSESDTVRFTFGSRANEFIRVDFFRFPSEEDSSNVVKPLTPKLTLEELRAVGEDSSAPSKASLTDDPATLLFELRNIQGNWQVVVPSNLRRRLLRDQPGNLTFRWMLSGLEIVYLKPEIMLADRVGAKEAAGTDDEQLVAPLGSSTSE